MRTLKLIPLKTDAELLQVLNNQKDISIFKKWQIIYSIQVNNISSASKISMLLGLTNSQVYQAVQAYNSGKLITGKLKTKGGRREKICLLSLEKEQELMQILSKKAALGEILTAKSIKEEVEKFVEKPVSDDYIWDLFKRCGWKKKSPMPKHPLSNKEEQDEFKKNSKKIWLPRS